MLQTIQILKSNEVQEFSCLWCVVKEIITCEERVMSWILRFLKWADLIKLQSNSFSLAFLRWLMSKSFEDVLNEFVCNQQLTTNRLTCTEITIKVHKLLAFRVTLAQDENNYTVKYKRYFSPLLEVESSESRLNIIFYKSN